MRNYIKQKKETLLKEIKEAKVNPETGKNSMGCSESYYDPAYLIETCFSTRALNKMGEDELNNLFKLAQHAADVFY